MTTKRYVICDLEATGLDSEAEIIELALLTFENDKVVDVFETLVNPMRAVPEFITNLTGISNRSLREAPKFYEISEAILSRLEGSVFVSHNTEFDLGLLRKKFREMGLELKVKEFCTLKVAQFEIPGLNNYNLDALCSFFNIKIQDRHRAIGDAKATLELFRELQDLRFKPKPKLFHLPHHDKILKKIPSKAGVLSFKNAEGKVLRLEASFNMEKTARELLLIKPANRELLQTVQTVEAELTGSALIAEFKKLRFKPFHPRFVIVVEQNNLEKNFKIQPFRKNLPGLWYFTHLESARKKIKELRYALKDDVFIYREGGKSKEEILKHNQKVEALSKLARFPADNLILIGEGRTLGEKSLVVIRKNHVLGYGHTAASDEEIYADPDKYLSRRYNCHPGVDLAARKHLMILKNLKHKTEGWRSLAETC